MHGPSFMGNPTACAAANASMDLFESEPRLEQVADLAAAFERLRPLENQSVVAEVRVRGAVAAVELNTEFDKYDAIQFFVSQGVWIRPINKAVYLAPSLNIEMPELQMLSDAIYAFVNQF